MDIDPPSSLELRDRILSDSSLAPLEQISRICAELRGAVSNDLKARKANPLNTAFPVASRLSSAAAHLINLRRFHRSAQNHTRELRREANERKSEVDSSVLELRNVEYEKDHLKREIAVCEETETVYGTVELHSLEEFMNRAPPHLTDELDPHKLFLNRLEFEKMERTRLAKLQAELEAKRAKVTEDILRKQQDMDKLDEGLENYLKGGAELAATLDVKLDPTGVLDPVRHLPKPLYILYRHLVGYQQSLVLTSPPLTVELRPATQPPLPKSGKEEDEERAAFYVRHDTEVVVTVRETPTLLVNMSFALLPRLGIIVISSRIPALDKSTQFKDPLSNLWPNDDGTESPVPLHDFLLIGNRPFSFSPEDAGGYAYTWAQHLCGLDFMAPVRQRDHAIAPWIEGEGGKKRPYISRVVELVRARIKSLQALGDGEKGRQFNAVVQAGATQVTFRVTISVEYPFVAPIFEFDLLKDAPPLEMGMEVDTAPRFKISELDDDDEVGGSVRDGEERVASAPNDLAATVDTPVDPAITALRAIDAAVNRTVSDFGLPSGDQRLLPIQMHTLIQMIDSHFASNSQT
ncbi:THO complex subunit 5 [Gonapodya sp. JEL0774]|nr:THO complex subunit 5 [Gonapodya sp. JEL0774]